jgi:hypothetical protein
MVERTNAHDLEGMTALIHKDYQSKQPFHPPAASATGRR